MEIVQVERKGNLRGYAANANLVHDVRRLEERARILAEPLKGRRVWMVNSTSRGGGIAEMLPRMISLFGELGVDMEWAVLETDRAAFFELTKNLHNLIHGEGRVGEVHDARALYEEVNRENAEALAMHIRPEDILVVHDPQPMAMGSQLKRRFGVPAIWRCHIGVDEDLPETRDAWDFLAPYANAYDRAVFTAEEYVPAYFRGRYRVIHPAIDPFSHKNRDLSAHKHMGVACNAGLAHAYAPVLTPPFEHPAQRYWGGGVWEPADNGEELGLFYRPIILQVSRWDRLKGWAPLLEAFVRLKSQNWEGANPRHRRRIDILRLVLAGPDPSAVADDPEALGVLEELEKRVDNLPNPLLRDVALLSLPMLSAKENALMVNALQRCATVVVQNSLREAFGLTATEAMWKSMPLLVSSACGLRQQVRDGIEGRVIQDANDSAELAAVLDEMLRDPKGRSTMGIAAQLRVHEKFLVFKQIQSWLEVLAEVAK